MSKVHDFYLSTFSNNYPAMPQPGTVGLNSNFFSNPDVINRRAHGKTIIYQPNDANNTLIEPKKPDKRKRNKSGIKDKGKIVSKVKAGINNLSYYKLDLAISEIESALKMLKKS